MTGLVPGFPDAPAPHRALAEGARPTAGSMAPATLGRRATETTKVGVSGSVFGGASSCFTRSSERTCARRDTAHKCRRHPPFEAAQNRTARYRSQVSALAPSPVRLPASKLRPRAGPGTSTGAQARLCHTVGKFELTVGAAGATLAERCARRSSSPWSSSPAGTPRRRLQRALPHQR